MSATGRSKVRDPDDFYETPAWCVHRLLEAVDLPGGHWLEPSAGRGAIIRAVNYIRRDVTWTAIEKRDRRNILGKLGTDYMGDFLSMNTAHFPRFDVVLGNPPYRQALEFVKRSFEFAEVTAMLLRLNFLASTKRNEFMRNHVPDVFVLPDRPSFTNGGTDACEYAWFVWRTLGRQFGTLRILPVTSPRERKRVIPPKLRIRRCMDTPESRKFWGGITTEAEAEVMEEEDSIFSDPYSGTT